MQLDDITVYEHQTDLVFDQKWLTIKFKLGGLKWQQILKKVQK